MTTLCTTLKALLLALLLLGMGVGPSAQTAAPAVENDTAQEESAPEETAQALPESPRAAIKQFLDAMNEVKRGEPKEMDQALATLDLSDINPLVRREQGINLAWTLLEVIDRTRYVEFDKVPERQTGEPWLFEKYPQGEVRIHANDQGQWRFDRQTLANLPKILDGLENSKPVVEGGDRSYLPWHLRFRAQLPDHLKQAPFILENWQWIGILITIASGLLLDKLLSLLLHLLVQRWKARRAHPHYQELSPDILRPAGLMAMAFAWWAGINLMGLPEGAMLILLVAVKFVASISGVWAAYRLIDLVSAHLLKKAEQTESKLDDALVPLIPKSLKVFITVVGFVFIADNLNIDISSLLAGLGLGGLAFALAAKDMVQNLFGSITVLLDRTFSVGDWILVEGIEGTVEEIGFRSTRIRTFYNSLITVPNSRFITAEVDNMGQRTYRRFTTNLSLAYNTPPDRIEAFCEGARELVRLHPYMRKDYYHIYLSGFADSAVQVLVYVFWSTPDWGTELRERHRFLLDLMRLAQRLDVEFAYPTRTLYMRGESPETQQAPHRGDEARQHARNEAKSIVEHTTGLGVMPPPVQY